MPSPPACSACPTRRRFVLQPLQRNYGAGDRASTGGHPPAEGPLSGYEGGNLLQAWLVPDGADG